jgi:hypothetical protein
MSLPEANVTSKSSAYQPLVIRAAAAEASATALAAWRTGFESLALSGFGHAATLAAMSGVSPVCASLSLPVPQLRFTSPARASVRSAGSFLPAPQPHSAALPSAHQHRLPLAAAWSAAPVFTRRSAATRPRWRQSNGTPNHALQRTAPGVTLAAADRPAACAHPAPGRLRPQPARRPPQSLSLGSLGAAPRIL